MLMIRSMVNTLLIKRATPLAFNREFITGSLNYTHFLTLGPSNAVLKPRQEYLLCEEITAAKDMDQQPDGMYHRHGPAKYGADGLAKWYKDPTSR